MALLVCLGLLSFGTPASSSETARATAGKPSRLYFPPSSVACKKLKIMISSSLDRNEVFLNVGLCNVIGVWGSRFPIWVHLAKGKQQGIN